MGSIRGLRCEEARTLGGSSAASVEDEHAWRDIYGSIIESTGWTLPEIDRLTWPEANDVLGYFSEHPNVHALTRIRMGITPKSKPSPANSSDAELVLQQAFGATVKPASELPACLKKG